MDARQRGLQEPRERALTWPRQATSKITSPTALQGLSRAHVGLSAPDAAKLGAEGHSYFWASLAARRSPPAPPKSRRKRGGRGRPQPQDAGSLPVAEGLLGDPMLLPVLSELAPFQKAHWGLP